MEKKNITYITVRIKEQVWVLFEDDFIDHNEFRTQNLTIEVLSKLYDKKDFAVELFYKVINDDEVQ